MTLRLWGRSSSHFTRVAVIFAHELDLAFELVLVRDLASLDPRDYGGNPALKLPTLHVGERRVFGTENICRTLTELAGRSGDARVVLAEHVHDDLVRSGQELVWHAMAAQVQLRIGGLSRLAADSMLLSKAATSLAGSLAWLERELDEVLARLPTPRELSLFEVALFCLLEHIVFLSTLSLDPYTQLRGFADRFGARDSAKRTPLHFDIVPTETPT